MCSCAIPVPVSATRTLTDSPFDVADAERAAFRHGVFGVQKEIQENLLGDDQNYPGSWAGA